MTSAPPGDGPEHDRSVTWAQRKLWGVYGVPTPDAPRLSVASDDAIASHTGRPERWVLDLVRHPGGEVIEFEVGLELEADLDASATAADEDDVTWILAQIADVDLG